MDDIDSKFDKFISSYSTDMKLLFEKLSFNQLNYEKRESLGFGTNLPNDNRQIKFYDSTNPQILARDLLKSTASRQANCYSKSNRLTKNISYSSIDEEKLNIIQESELNGRDKSELIEIDRFKRPKSLGKASTKRSNNNERRSSTFTTTNSIEEIGYYDVYDYENDNYYVGYDDEEDNVESEESIKKQTLSFSSSPKNTIKFNKNLTLINSLNNKKSYKKLCNESKTHKNLISILFRDKFRKKQKRKREKKLSMRKYLLNTIEQGVSFNDNKLTRKFKSDTELSTLSIKPFQDLSNIKTNSKTITKSQNHTKFNLKNFKNTKKTNLDFFKENSTNFKIRNPKTNLFNFLSKSDIVNKSQSNNNNNIKIVNNSKQGFVNFKIFGKFNLFKHPPKDVNNELPVFIKKDNLKPRSISSFNCLEVNETDAFIKTNQQDSVYIEKSQSETKLNLI